MLAMDVSGSMTATDVPPDPARRREARPRSRSSRACRTGFGVGVVSFSTGADVVVAEPTDDRDADRSA